MFPALLCQLLGSFSESVSQGKELLGSGRKGEVRDEGLMDIGLKRRIRGELRVKVLDSSVGPKKLEVFFLLKLPIRHDDSVTAYFHSL